MGLGLELALFAPLCPKMMLQKESKYSKLQFGFSYYYGVIFSKV